MFQLQERVPHIFDLLTTDSGLLLIDRQNENYKFILNGKSLNSSPLKNLNPVFIQYQGCVYCSESGNGECYKVDLKTGSTVLVSDKHIGLRAHHEEAFLITTKSDKVHDEIININTGKTLWKADTIVTHSYFPSDLYCCFFKKNHELSCFKKGSFQLLWKLDVSETGAWINRDKKEVKGEIVSIIGTWNKLLLLHVTQNRMLAINSHGKVEWEIGNFLLPEEQVYFPASNALDMRSTIRWFLAEGTNRLYMLGSRYVFEFDLISQKRKILKDYSKERTWFFKNGQLKDNCILFTGYKTGGWPNYTGILDIITNEIVWEYKLERSGYFVSHPIMVDNKIYIKDDENVLYVFNKE